MVQEIMASVKSAGQATGGQKKSRQPDGAEVSVFGQALANAADQGMNMTDGMQADTAETNTKPQGQISFLPGDVSWDMLASAPEQGIILPGMIVGTDLQNRDLIASNVQITDAGTQEAFVSVLQPESGESPETVSGLTAEGTGVVDTEAVDVLLPKEGSKLQMPDMGTQMPKEGLQSLDANVSMLQAGEQKPDASEKPLDVLAESSDGGVHKLDAGVTAMDKDVQILKTDVQMPKTDVQMSEEGVQIIPQKDVLHTAETAPKPGQTIRNQQAEQDGIQPEILSAEVKAVESKPAPEQAENASIGSGAEKPEVEAESTSGKKDAGTVSKETLDVSGHVQGQTSSVQSSAGVESLKASEHVTESGDIRAEYAEQLRDMIAKQVTSGKQEFEISLTPRYLGNLTIKVAYEAGRTSVAVICMEPKTMEAMAQQAEELGRILEMNLGGRTEVVVDSDKANQQPYDEGRSGGRQEQREPESRRNRQKEIQAADFLQQLRLGLV